MSHRRGDVVVAIDPFRDDSDDSKGRPFLVISREGTPFHGEQYIALSLTTRTWYGERIPLADDDWVDGGAPESSSIIPWSVNSVKNEWIAYRQGRLTDDIVATAVSRLKDYVA